MTESKITDGFKFAIISITAIAYFINFILNKIENTAIDPDIYLFFIFAITCSFVSLLYLFLYILIKGFTFELNDTPERIFLQCMASEIYVLAFYITILNVSIYLSTYLIVLTEFKYVIFFNLIVFIILSSAYSWSKSENLILKEANYKKKLKQKFVKEKNIHPFSNNLNKLSYSFMRKVKHYPLLFRIIFLMFHSKEKTERKKIDKFVNILTVTTFISFFIFIPSYLLTPGSVIIDIQNIYSKNDLVIPVSVQVTGPNENISIEILKENSNHNLIAIDNISLRPNQDQDKITHGENSTLLGYAIDYGKYTVYINTTNLTSGYYHFTCLRNNNTFERILLIE